MAKYHAGNLPAVGSIVKLVTRGNDPGPMPYRMEVGELVSVGVAQESIFRPLDAAFIQSWGITEGPLGPDARSAWGYFDDPLPEEEARYRLLGR